MKAILTLIFVVLFGVLAVAQEEPESPVATDAGRDSIPTAVIGTTRMEESGQGTDKVVRLYRFKYSKVHRELSFATKHNNPKLA